MTKADLLVSQRDAVLKTQNSSVGGKKRQELKFAKIVLSRAKENWMDYQVLMEMWEKGGSVGRTAGGYEDQALYILKSRADELLKMAANDVEKFNKRESKKTAKSEVTPAAPKKTPSKERKVGERHPNGLWIWTEYKEGKFDWRIDPAQKKQGQRNDLKK